MKYKISGIKINFYPIIFKATIKKIKKKKSNEVLNQWNKN